MSTEANKALVRRYYAAGVDKGNVDVFDEVFAADCIIHRPEAPEPMIGLEDFKRGFDRTLNIYSEIKTTLHDIIALDDYVVVRLSHQAVSRGNWTSRIGEHEVDGKSAQWGAFSIFKFTDGKVVEEWVMRDELGMLIQLGVLSPYQDTGKS